MATKGKDVSAFQAAHDKAFIVPKAIKQGLAELSDSWEYEAEFIKRCKLSQTDFSKFREQFKAHVIETSGRNPKRVWAGTVKFAGRLRAKLQ